MDKKKPNSKLVRFPNMGNVPMYEAIVSKFTSNAGGTHDNRPKRLRTRKNVKNYNIKDGW